MKQITYTMLQQTHTLVKANNHNDDGLYTLIDNIPDSIIVTDTDVITDFIFFYFSVFHCTKEIVAKEGDRRNILFCIKIESRAQ